MPKDVRLSAIAFKSYRNNSHFDWPKVIPSFVNSMPIGLFERSGRDESKIEN